MSSVLYIDPFLPLHDRNSGSLRLYRILQLLKDDGHAVSFLPHTIWVGQEKYAYDLMNLGIEVLGAPEGTHTDSSLEAALAGRHFDTIVVSFYNIAAIYIPYLRRLCPYARIVVDTVDLHFVRERRQAETTHDAALAAKAEQTHVAEIAAYSQADALIAISDVEQATLHAELPSAEIFVIPNVHEVLENTPGYGDRRGLVFVGNFWHTPNGEGIVWFCKEVLPELLRRMPDITVDIVGQDPPAELGRFLNNHVRAHGWVQSVEPFLNSARLSIAPLLHGAGLKGKVGEALAAGLPVVSTSIGAEGLGLRNGENAMVADGVVAFADAIVTAHESEELWQRLATNGREVIRAAYTPAAVRNAVRLLVPPTPTEPVAYFGVPDWSDTAQVEAVIRSYIEAHKGTDHTTLHLGIHGIEINSAFHLLSIAVANLGYDPETIPDITLTPMTDLSFDFLKPSTIWVPMRADLTPPTHLNPAPPTPFFVH